MRLTNFSDFALRMLMYAASADDRLITIEETARTFKVSKTHLNKVANTLTRGGYLKAVRGRSGGLALGLRPEMIRIGDVIRLTEPDFAVVECFTTGNQCVLTGCCKLSSMFGEAIASFQSVLDRYTLADINLPLKDFPGGPTPPTRTEAARNGK
ncbi:Rrf2 family transcriptional regulator [Mesorhizobium sp.]|uniref:RrF2 family transcriptional regulator n=1 Tax=Mesorhizobium sp. TaxID=1871066 RepID=UPI000FE96BC4|nr:Rrf2 family transcriptional regulator [Mesorhizobium sp.]RWE03118.1 MAG: Rrf2 family transcriptional regulator [Mesorhizobium sp.]